MEFATAGSALISDAVHNSGDPLFYFLSPLVLPPRYSGVLDRTLSPEVTVARVEPRSGVLTTIALFTATGRGAERVRLANDGWTIRWATANAGLRSSDSYRIVVRTGGTVRGFADLAVVDRPDELRGIDRSSFAAVVRGQDLMIRFRIEGGATTPNSDLDGDGVLSSVDNCPTIANTNQLDTDGNHIGDACECEGAVCNALECRQPGTCDASTGACIDNVFLADGTVCSDNNACTENDRCTSGKCRPSSTLSCDDGDACTLDRCMPSTGCVTEANPECTYSGRPCRADAFFAELADNAAEIIDWDNNVLLPAAATQLSSGANAIGRPWFCGPDQITCPNGQVQVHLYPLLADRSTPSFRSDGHKRFYRMYFTGPGGARLSVRPGKQCAVVAAFRASMGSFGEDTRYTSFGRECDAQALGIDGQPSAEMAEWHLWRMGVDPGAINLQPPAPANELVEGALIDTGVIDPVAQGIGVLLPEESFVTGGHHKHGTGMSLFIRQLAPNAALRSSRVLDQNAASSSAHVARAIDNALFASGNNKPLVINMSFGWPAALSQPSALYGQACIVNEGPLGESVRYALRIARMLDTSPAPNIRRPVFVTSATGNQPLPADPSLFPPAIPGFIGDDVPACPGQPPIAGEQWFFPAAYHRSWSCEALPSATPTVFGVGAVDDRERPAALSIINAESPLVAPGEHVYATFAAAPLTPPEPMCTSIAPAPPVTLPAVFSGSSVASALVAGAAIRAQHARVAASLSPLRAAALGKLLYLTGETVCDANGSPRSTNTVPGMPIVRRLHVGRLDHALSAPQCVPLIACATSATNTPLTSCTPQLASCGLEALDASGALRLSCANSQVSVAWPENYEAPLCPAPAPIDDVDTLIDEATCASDPDQCAGNAPYRTLLGSVGPLPTDPGCLECLAWFKSSAPGAINLLLELNPAFAAGTTFTKKVVRYAGPNLAAGGTYSVVYTSLDNPATDDLWVPGASLNFTVAAPNFDYSQTKVTLMTTITIPGSGGGADVSPLRLKLD